MMKTETPLPLDGARREFLQRSGQLAVGSAALPLALNLAAIGEAAAADASDYKALVCIFLYGGNDCANTVVTYDTASYARYATIRGGSGQSGGGLAIARAALTPTLLTPTTPLPGGRQYALHPSMAGLAGLFHAGHAAVQLNVGSLVVPVTRAQIDGGNRTLYPLPPKLFSHNDQQAVWQCLDDSFGATGWGGRIGDVLLSGNSRSTFTCISAAGNASFLSGQVAMQYQIASTGPVRINSMRAPLYGSAAAQAAMATLVQRPSAHLLENEYVRITASAIAAELEITSAMEVSASMQTQFPAGNDLGDQLKMVARLIAGRQVLGATKRQIFFVNLATFDLHDNATAQQPALLAKLSNALVAFYNSTVELGVADQVTAFTSSEFGRTLAVNGDGTDHGWGSHHFVVGGAVKGTAFYGTAPPISVGNTAAADDQSHIGQGRLIPTTSIDQYAATLARWFGVPDAQLNGILPNLANFGAEAGRPDYPRDMGFMDQA